MKKPTKTRHVATECGVCDKNSGDEIEAGYAGIRLPKSARIPFTRCNLPADIFGSLTFHEHPCPVQIDGTASLYASLLKQLDTVESEALRSQRFMDYMDVFFCLNQLEKAGLDPENARHRGKADYLRVARGWSFDPDGREAAVLKGWVQSRFGLLPRYHGEPIDSPDSEAYLRFQEMRSMGIYNTNALDSQLDLLYTFCQYELSRRFPEKTHLRLFRGVNRWDQYETLYECSKRERILLLNNLNSFSDSRERAEEFGDVVFQAEIPIQKICFFHQLLPRMLKGEGEFVVLGGVARVKRVL